MKLRLDLRLSQKLIMTPQLQQAIKLLQLSRLELQQTLAQHLDENPMLEEAEVDTEEGDAIDSEEWNRDKQEIAQTGSGETGEAQAAGSENAEELSAAGWEDYFDSDRRDGHAAYSYSSQDDSSS